MSRLILHIFPTNIKHSTRLFKEAEYTLTQKIVDRVIVMALWYDGQLPQETLQNGLEVIRVKTVLRKYYCLPLVNKITLLRNALVAFSLFQYFFCTIRHARRLRPQHISCHYVSLLPLSWITARLIGATLEYLPHELETKLTGLSGVKQKIQICIEHCFIRTARNVVVVCDPIRSWYQDTYGLKNLHIVRNVPQKKDAQIRSIPLGGFRQIFNVPSTAKIFIYQGFFCADRGIEVLLGTFASLDPLYCHLVLMGYGEKNYTKMINEAVLTNSNIHFHPAVTADWIISYSASADVGILISEEPSLSYRYSLPNKFFEWAHAGLPIIVSENLEYQAKLLKEGGFGWSIPIKNLKSEIQRISKADLTQYSKNARNYAKETLWDNDAKVFSYIYSDHAT
jgi:glycosyltransferase involved in cell wall biosynthesis